MWSRGTCTQKRFKQYRIRPEAETNKRWTPHRCTYMNLAFNHGGFKVFPKDNTLPITSCQVAWKVTFTFSLVQLIGIVSALSFMPFLEKFFMDRKASHNTWGGVACLIFCHIWNIWCVTHYRTLMRNIASFCGIVIAYYITSCGTLTPLLMYYLVIIANFYHHSLK